jgi:hypothetical protein
MTEEQFKKRCAEILRENIHFYGPLGDYVIHGALDAIWKLHTKQKLNIHGVSGKRPYRCSNCQAELILDEVINDEITLRQAAGVPTRSEGKAGD